MCGGVLPANVSAQHKRRKLLTSLFLLVEVCTIHMQLFPSTTSSSLPLCFFWRDYLFVVDGVVGRRCFAQQSGCLVTWSYNCLPAFVVFCIQTNPKWLLQLFDSGVCCVHSGGEMLSGEE